MTPAKATGPGPLTVIARAKSRPGFEKDLESALRAVISPTHEEPGCVRYALHRSLENPSVVMTVERWKSRADFDRHLNSLHVQELFRQVAGMVSAPPEIDLFELLPAGDREKGSL